MKKKIILPFGFIFILVVSSYFLFFKTDKSSLSSPQANLNEEVKEIKPSETLIDYSDPVGFSLSYPDNLSIAKIEIEDPAIYTDLQLYSKDVNGSLNVKIADSEYKTLEEWIKANKIPESNIPTEKKLGELKALEVKTADRLMLAALDQGVLFTVEMPLVEQDFWIGVYEKVLTNFSFAVPETNSSSDVVSNDSSESEVIFEGEEVVE